jgi:long-chain acyl-CoA synthetase
MLGYFNDRQATADRIDSQGWLDTGDQVELDAETGQLRILGRADDVIVLSDGHKVHPQSIEREIQSVAGVRHALVVAAGRRTDVWIDAEESRPWPALREAIRSALRHRPTWEQPAEILRFDSPLSATRGELTAKGAIRRKQILLNRAITAK